MNDFFEYMEYMRPDSEFIIRKIKSQKYDSAIQVTMRAKMPITGLLLQQTFELDKDAVLFRSSRWVKDEIINRIEKFNIKCKEYEIAKNYKA